MNKKGLELSINFLVLLILAMAIFGYSVSFIYDLFAKTSQLEQVTFDRLDQQVESLSCRTEQVCIGTARKTIDRGSFKIFGIRILNSKNDDADFTLTVQQTIGDSELNFKPNTREFSLGPGDLQTVGIGVEVPDDAESGNYVLDVRVTSNDQPYGEQEVYKINVIVP